ncbi:hypothetical protein HDU97_009635 [Phlyctochytrium planicorne]|nr:hypothetical protein HDU97_009635 [Phlyctochytrium planicorne]
MLLGLSMRTTAAILVLAVSASVHAAGSFDTTCLPDTGIVFQEFGLFGIGDIKVGPNPGIPNITACQCADKCKNTPGCIIFAYGNSLVTTSSENYHACYMKGPIANTQNHKTYFKATGQTVDGSFAKRGLSSSNSLESCKSSCALNPKCFYVTIFPDGKCQTEQGDDHTDTEIGFIINLPVTSSPSQGQSSTESPSPSPSSPPASLNTPNPSSSNSNLSTAQAAQSGSFTGSSADPTRTSELAPQSSTPFKLANTNGAISPTGSDKGLGSNTNSSDSGNSSNNSVSIGLGVAAAIVVLATVIFVVVFYVRRKKQRENAIREWSKKFGGVGGFGSAPSKSTENLVAGSAAISVVSDDKKEEYAMAPITPSRGNESSSPADITARNTALNASTSVKRPSNVKYTKPFTREQYLSAGWTAEQLDTIKPPILVTAVARADTVASDPSGLNRTNTMASTMPEPIEST